MWFRHTHAHWMMKFLCIFLSTLHHDIIGIDNSIRDDLEYVTVLKYKICIHAHRTRHSIYPYPMIWKIAFGSLHRYMLWIVWGRPFFAYTLSHSGSHIYVSVSMSIARITHLWSLTKSVAHNTSFNMII